MCASTPEKVEIINPPENSVKGDRIIVDEYPGLPVRLYVMPNSNYYY